MKRYFCIVVMAALLIGCKTQSVVLPQLRDSVVVRTETRYDSIFIDRWHERTIKADTVFVRDSVYIERWRNAIKIDSIFCRDSIPYKVTEYIKVRERNGYDRFVSFGFWILIAVILAAVALRLIFRR